MAIALLCRFYHWELETAGNLTLKQSQIFMNEMAEILRLESGGTESKEQTVLEGKAAHNAAMALIKSGIIRSGK